MTEEAATSKGVEPLMAGEAAVQENKCYSLLTNCCSNSRGQHVYSFLSRLQLIHLENKRTGNEVNTSQTTIQSCIADMCKLGDVEHEA